MPKTANHIADTSTRKRIAGTISATAKAEVTLDPARRLYVIHHPKSHTACLGYDVAEARRVAVLEWLGHLPTLIEVGTVEAYTAYALTMLEGSRQAAKGKGRCPAELTPQLIGLEGKRVEVVDAYGHKRRFTVGRSTGWMPCHCEIKQNNSKGGVAVTGAPFRSLKVL